MLDDLSKKSKRTKKTSKKKTTSKSSSKGKTKLKEEKGWIKLIDYCKVNNIPRSTAQRWYVKIKGEDKRKDTDLNTLFVKKKTIDEFFDKHKRWIKSRRK